MYTIYFCPTLDVYSHKRVFLSLATFFIHLKITVHYRHTCSTSDILIAGNSDQDAVISITTGHLHVDMVAHNSKHRYMSLRECGSRYIT